MDNRRVDVTSEGASALASAIGLAWAGAPGGKASHYKVTNVKAVTEYWGSPTTRHSVKHVEDAGGTPTLVFLWHAERDAVPLPYPMDMESAINMASGWLREVPRGRQPDHDGDNGLGWRVFTEAWGHVLGLSYAIVGIQPAW